MKSKYIVEIKNRFDALNNEEDIGVVSNSTMYNHMIEAHKVAAEKCVPKHPKIRRKAPWEDDNVISKREHLRKVASIKREDCTPVNMENFKQAIVDLNNAYETSQKQFIENSVQRITNANDNHKSSEVWRICNQVTERKKVNKSILKADSPSHRLDLWRKHFEDLLAPPSAQGNNPTTSNFIPKTMVNQELPINTDNFTMDELEQCLKKVSTNKAAGLDEIPGEVWKIGSLKEDLLDVCNKTLNGDKPHSWSQIGIKPIPKKGNLTLAQNYRGIALSPVAAKIYNRMLLLRIRPHLDPLLRKNQNGFREGRSTVAQILTLRRIIEGIKAKRLPAICTFVDFKKAFDSVDRAKMVKILSSYGIPEKLVNAIAVMYENT